ncbi:hypothetical protein DMH18_26695 [Streptomyces sp. WAC 06783]|uniref:hypothetical protein n=1 Tax=Streptomyces sp. WAC 06783 TaxID=2203211 RepID=UPI000F743F2D|nr:hypothetical protein [Streptomyces sp. WAC 06783]RSO07026.1 hypothetical protein DMH18_26695 [Streptomyces sp. WAC 06783]
MVTLPIALALLITVWALIKKWGLKAGHAVAATLLGFLLRDTQLAAPLDRLMSTITQAVGHWQP